jgi:predicted membrane-bound spermidine synthase
MKQPKVTSKKIQSKFNGELEITVRNGRKVLDSEKTNYSHGTVQDVWKKGLKKVDLTGVERILLLGLGGGSIVHILDKDYKYDGKLTAVEIDPVIIEIAQKEFGVVPHEKLKIKCADAFEFVGKKKKRKKFNLIIVDIFLDRVMPEQLLSDAFWQDLKRLTEKGGTIIFNAFHYTRKLAPIRKELKRLGFELTEHLKVNGSNNMIVAKRAVKAPKVEVIDELAD